MVDFNSSPVVGVGTSRRDNVLAALDEALSEAQGQIGEHRPSFVMLYISPTFLWKIASCKIDISAELLRNNICSSTITFYGSTPIGVGALYPNGEICIGQQFITGQDSCPQGDIISVLLVSWKNFSAQTFIVKFKGKRTGSLRSVRPGMEFPWKANINFSEVKKEKSSTVECIRELLNISHIDSENRKTKCVLVQASASYAGTHFSLQGLESVFPNAEIVGGQLLPKVLSLPPHSPGLLTRQPSAKIYAGYQTSSQLGGLAINGKEDEVCFHYFVFNNKRDDEAELDRKMQKYRDAYVSEADLLYGDRGLRMRPVFAFLEACAGRIPGAVMVRGNKFPKQYLYLNSERFVPNSVLTLTLLILYL